MPKLGREKIPYSTSLRTRLSSSPERAATSVAVSVAATMKNTLYREYYMDPSPSAQATASWVTARSLAHRDFLSSPTPRSSRRETSIATIASGIATETSACSKEERGNRSELETLPALSRGAPGVRTAPYEWEGMPEPFGSDARSPLPEREVASAECAHGARDTSRERSCRSRSARAWPCVR
jgi:hypothetical protein